MVDFKANNFVSSSTFNCCMYGHTVFCPSALYIDMESHLKADIFINGWVRITLKGI
jgi:hypothetical protein